MYRLAAKRQTSNFATNADRNIFLRSGKQKEARSFLNFVPLGVLRE